MVLGAELPQPHQPPANNIAPQQTTMADSLVSVVKGVVSLIKEINDMLEELRDLQEDMHEFNGTLSLLSSIIEQVCCGFRSTFPRLGC